MKYKYDDTEIEYILVEREKRKTISLKIKNKKVEIIYPKKIRNKLNVDDILIKHKKWIIKNLEKSVIELDHTYKDGDIFYLKGEKKYLKLIRKENKKVYIINDILYIESPSLSVVNIKKIIREFYEKETLNFVTPIIREKGYANEIFVKYYKSLWGVCVNESKLGFSSRLICVPPSLIYHVVYHEISHLYYSDHGKGFYNVLESMYPNYRKDKKLLNELATKNNYKL